MRGQAGREETNGAVMDHHGSGTLDLDHRAAVQEAPEPVVDGSGPPASFEVPRMSLIEIVKLALADLHERRRRSESYPVVERLEDQIKCWEDALAWLKDQPGSCLSLQGAAPPSHCC
jgi:hypothetical protein